MLKGVEGSVQAYKDHSHDTFGDLKAIVASDGSGVEMRGVGCSNGLKVYVPRTCHKLSKSLKD
jgi:hypothetical protein